MSNELELVPEKGTSVFLNNEEYASGFEIAKVLSRSMIVPKEYQGKPENCLIALDYARQVNTSPLIVMQNLYIVHGKPSWSSTYIAAVIRSKFRNVQVKLDGQGDDRGCQIIAQDENGNILEGTRITMGMARCEGWISKNGSKWQVYPDLMLQYRANAFFGRVFCPEKLLGILSEYEVKDITVDKEKPEVIDVFAVETAIVSDNLTVEPEITQDEVETYAEYEMNEPEQASLLQCSDCGCSISQKVYDFSLNNFGTPKCMKCQKVG